MAICDATGVELKVGQRVRRWKWYSLPESTKIVSIDIENAWAQYYLGGKFVSVCYVNISSNPEAVPLKSMRVLSSDIVVCSANLPVPNESGADKVEAGPKELPPGGSGTSEGIAAGIIFGLDSAGMPPVYFGSTQDAGRHEWQHGYGVFTGQFGGSMGYVGVGQEKPCAPAGDPAPEDDPTFDASDPAIQAAAMIAYRLSREYGYRWCGKRLEVDDIATEIARVANILDRSGSDEQRQTGRLMFSRNPWSGEIDVGVRITSL